MDFKQLELADKAVIDAYLSAQRIESSELTFLTFYIWRKVFNVRFAEHSGCLVVEFKDNDYPPSLRFPMGSGDKKTALKSACSYYKQQGLEPKVYGMTKDMLEQLLEIYPDKFIIKPMRDYFDYVYETEKLTSLPGRALHSKRNHVNKFKRTYNYKYEPMTSADADEIITEYDNWLSKHDVDMDYYLEGERQSIGDILRNFDALGCQGAKLYADGKLCAFTIGEQLNSDTAVIHIEKADIDFNGAYAAMNQLFAENQWSHLKYINREDDFGVPGLRRAKKSYRPVFMIEKYSATLTGEIEGE